MANEVFERIQSEIERAPGDALHEGHRDVPAMRVLGARGADPDAPGRAVQDGERAGGRRSCARASSSSRSGRPIPQLYVKGEFVGGCDIVTEMFQSGELETLLAEKGVEHKTEA